MLLAVVPAIRCGLRRPGTARSGDMSGRVSIAAKCCAISARSCARSVSGDRQTRVESTAVGLPEERGVVVCRLSTSSCRRHASSVFWAWCWPMVWCDVQDDGMGEPPATKSAKTGPNPLSWSMSDVSYVAQRHMLELRGGGAGDKSWDACRPSCSARSPTLYIGRAYAGTRD